MNSNASSTSATNSKAKDALGNEIFSAGRPGSPLASGTRTSRLSGATMSGPSSSKSNASQTLVGDADELGDEQRDRRILLVEDERDLMELLRYNLAREGYEVRTAGTGEDALQMIKDELPDLVLLDLMLPAMDGLEVCRTLRKREATANIPIIMLTAKGEEADVVTGLEMGADDYITKPFSPRVLLARISAVLRRKAVRGGGESSNVIVAGDITIDPERHEVSLGGQPIELTATEFKLITLMATRPGRVFTRQQIIESIHDGFAAVTDRSVDVQVVSLRRKLGDVGRSIETVRGVGYRFRD